jgi:predicted small integral membrane protein
VSPAKSSERWHAEGSVLTVVWMKWVIRTALGFIGVLVIAVVVVVLNAGRLVKKAVQEQGTSSLRLDTTLDRASVSLLGGKLDLHGLAIASPRGFSAPHMLEIGDLGATVDYGELRKEPIHIASITIDKPVLVIEQSGGALNFRKAMDMVPASPRGKQPMKLIIDELKLENARVLVRPGVPGLASETAVTVPSIMLKDIGRGRGAQNGAAMKDVAMHVVSALAAAAAKSGALPTQVRALLNLNADQVASHLGSEARKRIAGAIPGQLGQDLSGALEDPAVAKDPASVLRNLAGTKPAARAPQKDARH